MSNQNRKISLCLTTFNRVEETLRSFQNILDDDRVSEIVIVDDCSNSEIYERLEWAIQALNGELLHKTIEGKTTPQIRLKRNDKNVGVYKNKIRSVELATNSWCIVFDSDNIIDKNYVDKLYQYFIWDNNCIYSPDFAMPEFDYTQFAGKIVSKENVADFTKFKMFDCWINTMNYFVNKNVFLRADQDEVIPDAADSMYINYLLLKKGISIFTVPEMRYIHTVHQESNYVKKSYGDRHLLTETLKAFRNGFI